LIARQLVDAAIAILIGHYFLGQAEHCVATKGDRKKKVAEFFHYSSYAGDCNEVCAGQTG